MRQDFLFAGFGGQGVMSMGMALAYAAAHEGWQVSWLPAYGPEQRGGTANCMVVVSDAPIGSPLVTDPDCAVVMNLPSLERFGPRVKPGGYLFLNRTLIPAATAPRGVTAFAVPTAEVARELGDARVGNMVMLGAVLAVTGVVSLAAAAAALEKVLPERHRHLLALNQKALDAGAALVRESARPGVMRR